jgi:hypothetical protein
MSVSANALVSALRANGQDVAAYAEDVRAKGWTFHRMGLAARASEMFTLALQIEWVASLPV